MSETQMKPLFEKFMQASGAVLGAVHQPLGEPLTKMAEEYEVNEGMDSFLAQTASGASPKAASTADFLARNPYVNPISIKNNMKETAGRGWITISDGGFSATEKAQTFTNALVQMLIDNLAGRESEVKSSLPRTVELLEKLVEFAHSVSGFDKPTLSFSRNYEYKDRTPSLLWVRRHLVSMSSYRDDCHIASWQGLDFSGIEWETLTFVWQDNAHTAAELTEALPFRGYTEDDYQAALDALVTRGLLAREDEKYVMTEKGTALRQQAEDKTNELYLKAFACITEEEQDELIGLLAGFAEAHAPEEEAAQNK